MPISHKHTKANCRLLPFIYRFLIHYTAQRQHTFTHTVKVYVKVVERRAGAAKNNLSQVAATAAVSI